MKPSCLLAACREIGTLTAVLRLGVAAFAILGLAAMSQAQDTERVPASLAPVIPSLEAGRTVDVVAHEDIRPFLHSDDPRLAANKRVVFDFWRQVVNGGQEALLAEFVSEQHREYSVAMAGGREGFGQGMLSRTRPGTESVPDTVLDPVVAMVAEGDYVAVATVTHYLEPDGSGETYTSTSFDLFQLEEGKVVAHWDSRLPERGQVVLPPDEGGPLPVMGVEGLEQYPMIQHDDPELFANKRLVFDLWRHTAEAGREEVALLYLDPIYIQHNPNAVTGREGFMSYFGQRPETMISTYYEAPLVALLAEGDLVVQVLQGERVNPERPGEMIRIAWFDMFRIQDGRVIEHWDAAAKGEFPTIMMEDTQ